jgi:NDP-sugar pyrophosphorylase family protein
MVNSIGAQNTANGAFSMQNNTTGTANAAFGESAFYSNTTGSNNTVLGQAAGNSNTTGNNNIYIGSGANLTSSTISNQTIIGNSSTTNAEIKGALKTNGFVSTINTKTSAYTILTSDEIIAADASSSAFTVTLPTAVGVAGQTYTIKRINTGSNAVTVGTTSSQTIDGATTYALSIQYKYVKVVSNGTNWIIVGNN